MLAAQYLLPKRPKSFMSSGAFGTMGFSMPCSIGVYFANPGSKVIAIDGDGSLKMNMGEIHTIGIAWDTDQSSPANNHADGMVRTIQAVFMTGNSQDLNGTTTQILPTLPRVRFQMVPQDIEREDLEPAMKRVPCRRRPLLSLEVVTDREEELYPVIPQGKGYKDMVSRTVYQEVTKG